MKTNLINTILGRLFGLKCRKEPTKSYIHYPVKSTLNDATIEPSTVKEEQQEATNVFNSQTIGFNSDYHLRRVVGHVLWSDEDVLEGDGNVSATYTVTPVHAFDDQAGHGDYYLVNATYTIANAKMYHPNHANYHGGVRVRIGGFCLSECDIDASIYSGDKKIDGVKLFSSSPKPETTIDTHTYTVADSWNIGGSVTGGIKGTASPSGTTVEGSGSVTFNWGVAHSKTDTYSVSDLNVKNNSNSCDVSFTLENRNVVKYYWPDDYGLTDCAEFAKSSLMFHATWIWYIPNATDNDEKTQFNIKTTIKPKYKSCRFYSSYADYDEWFDTLENVGVCELYLPNRQPSGYVEIKNDTDDTITNVTFYDMRDGKVLYASKSSFTKDSVAKFCMPTGNGFITFERGKTSSDKKKYAYANSDHLDITRGNTINLAASFDFIEVSQE